MSRFAGRGCGPHLRSHGDSLNSRKLRLCSRNVTEDEGSSTKWLRWRVSGRGGGGPAPASRRRPLRWPLGSPLSSEASVVCLLSGLPWSPSSEEDARAPFLSPQGTSPPANLGSVPVLGRGVGAPGPGPAAFMERWQALGLLIKCCSRSQQKLVSDRQRAGRSLLGAVQTAPFWEPGPEFWTSVLPRTVCLDATATLDFHVLTCKMRALGSLVREALPI